MLALMCVSTYVRAQAGTVLATNGQNQIQRSTETIQPLKPGTAVRSRDTLITEPDGRLQVRFVDGAIVSMQPATQFRVDQYQFKKKESSSFFSLFRGAVRMASGLIGKKDPQQWRLTTPSATIGIRGTHFVVQHTVCDPDCSPGDKPGTQVSVTQGEVMVSNAGGSILLGANQSAWVSDQYSPPLADRWTPEMAPRNVPRAKVPNGPGRSTQGSGSADSPDKPAEPSGSPRTNEPTQTGNTTDPSDDKSERSDGDDAQSGNNPTRDGSGKKPDRNDESANDPAAKPEAGDEVDRGANSGLRWQPTPSTPFEPVRDIALADPDLTLGSRPGATRSQQPGLTNPDQDAGDQSGSDRGDGDADTDSDTQYPDNVSPESPDTPAANNDESADNSNDGGNNGNGSNRPTVIDNTDPDPADPVIANPGEPTVTDPVIAGPGPTDPDPTDPVTPAPGKPSVPQTGSSIASNWYLDVRPLPDFVQRGLLADPQSAVIFDQGITLESIGNCKGGVCISRGTAIVADAGHDEYAAWGRWTDGDIHIQVFGLTKPVTLSANEGLHYIVGSPTLTIPTRGSFTYNLSASTAPTLSNDWYAPGKFSGQASVQFSAGAAPRVGLDARVDIANDQFQFNTNGGAANPGQSELTLDSNLQFSGELNAQGGDQSLPWMCSGTGCRTRVEGGLFGPTGQRLGVSYSIQSESGSTRINGVGIFSRP